MKKSIKLTSTQHDREHLSISKLDDCNELELEATDRHQESVFIGIDKVGAKEIISFLDAYIDEPTRINLDTVISTLEMWAEDTACDIRSVDRSSDRAADLSRQHMTLTAVVGMLKNLGDNPNF